MHLWPSTRIRESFKIAYLSKLEWNLHRMNAEKKRSQQQQSLLDQKAPQENGAVPDTSSSSSSKSCSFGKYGLIFKEIPMALYSCFCCGVCVDEDEE